MSLIEMIKGWFGTKEEPKSQPEHPVKQQKGLNLKPKYNKKKKENSGRRKKRN